jgi:hypothetical protein
VQSSLSLHAVRLAAVTATARAIAHRRGLCMNMQPSLLDE